MSDLVLDVLEAALRITKEEMSHAPRSEMGQLFGIHYAFESAIHEVRICWAG